jgi:hypothetical protein
MANTNFIANTSSYTNTDLIDIINKKTPLAYLYTSYSGNQTLFPLINSIPYLNDFYSTVDEGPGAGKLYIPTGNQYNINLDNKDLQIVLLPNSGVKVYENFDYEDTLYVQAYNNSNSLVFVEPSGGSNSSIELYNNTSGNFNNNTANTGYSPVSST